MQQTWKEKLIQKLVEPFQKVTELANPCNIVLPWLIAIFKKFLGNFFNEQISSQQIQKMGLTNLTLKAQSINQNLSPSIPFVIEKGTIGRIKLDTKTLNFLVENVDIYLRFKTINEHREQQRGQDKAQINAEIIQNFKLQTIKNFTQRENKITGGWQLFIRFLRKITLTVNNITIHIQDEEKFSLNTQNVSLRVRSLPENAEMMVLTILVGGVTAHINGDRMNDRDSCQKESCIMSMFNNFDGKKFDQYIMMHLKVNVKDKVRFNSTINVQRINFHLTIDQIKQLLKLVAKVTDHQKWLIAQDKYIHSTIKRVDQKDRPFKWSKNFLLINDYFGLNNQYNECSKPLTIDSEDISSIQFQSLVKSEIDDVEDETPLEQQDVFQDPDDFLSSSFCQSSFTQSVFRELVPDDVDKQGLQQLDTEGHMFSLVIEKIRLVFSYQNLSNKQKLTDDILHANHFQLDADMITYNMEKQENNKKKSQIGLHQLSLVEIQYKTTFDNNQAEDDLFMSCNEELSIYQGGYQQYLMNEQAKRQYITILPMIQVFGWEKKQEFNVAKYFQGKRVFQPLFDYQIGVRQKEILALKIKIDHTELRQSISIQNIDFQLTFEQLKVLLQFQIDYERKAPQDNQVNITQNIFTIHTIRGGLLLKHSPIMEFCYNVFELKQLTHFVEFQSLYACVYELQLQTTDFLQATFKQIQLFYLQMNKIRYYELMADIKQKEFKQTELKPIIRFQKQKDSNRVEQLIPQICFGIPQAIYYFAVHHVELFKSLGQKFKEIQPESNGKGYFTISFLVEELICYVGGANQEIANNQYISYKSRLTVHASKCVALITSYNKELENEIQGKQIYANIYNVCVVDHERYSKLQPTDIPIYGTPTKTCQDTTQKLCFKGVYYDAKDVIFYKQESFNRLDFENLYRNDIFEIQSDMQFINTNQLFQNKIYLDPNPAEFLNNESNVISFNMDFDVSKIILKISHSTVNVDELLLDTIDHIKQLVDMINENSQPGGQKVRKQIKIQTNNLWVSLLPTYRQSTLLKNYFGRYHPIEKIVSQIPEQLYYSWVRLLFEINHAEVELHDQQLIYYHLKEGQLFMKLTQQFNQSQINPILLISPKQTIYQRGLQATQVIHIDNDQKTVLDSLFFKSLMEIKGVTFKENTISVGQIECNLKKDSLLALVDIVQMYEDKFINQKTASVQTEQNIYQTINYNYDIFNEDKVEEQFNEVKKPKLTLQLREVCINITNGVHFVPECFQELQDANNYIETFEVFHVEHSQLIMQYNYFENEVNDESLFQIKMIDLKSQYSENDFQLQIRNVDIYDMVRQSKFRKVFGKQLTDDNYFIRIYSNLKKEDLTFQLRIQPIRLCISGPFIQQSIKLIGMEVKQDPKYSFFLTLEGKQDEMRQYLQKLYYEVYYQQQKYQTLKLNKFIIDQIQVHIAFDGTGIDERGVLQGLIKIAAYDNLVIKFSRAMLRLKTFDKESDLYKFLVEQYTQQLKSDNLLKAQFFTKYKSIENLHNIISNVKNVFNLSIREGIRVGIYKGTLPVGQAILKEIILLTEAPIKIASAITTQSGFSKMSNMMNLSANFLNRVGDQISQNSIPKDFLK